MLNVLIRRNKHSTSPETTDADNVDNDDDAGVNSLVTSKGLVYVND